MEGNLPHRGIGANSWGFSGKFQRKNGARPCGEFSPLNQGCSVLSPKRRGKQGRPGAGLLQGTSQCHPRELGPQTSHPRLCGAGRSGGSLVTGGGCDLLAASEAGSCPRRERRERHEAKRPRKGPWRAQESLALRPRTALFSEGTGASDTRDLSSVCLGRLSEGEEGLAWGEGSIGSQLKARDLGLLAGGEESPLRGQGHAGTSSCTGGPQRHHPHRSLRISLLCMRVENKVGFLCVAVMGPLACDPQFPSPGLRVSSPRPRSFNPAIPLTVS